MVGRRLNGFVVERELGAGGMGMVVLARQESLDRLAVLKRIHPQLGSDPELEARFEREAIAAGRLHHPNVVSVYDRFVHRGDTYMATEFVDGIDLAGVLASESRLPWRIAATIALELAKGLEAIHATGTLHRDLKPHNILVGRRGEVKITDFGLALDASGEALTQPGIAVGTPPYMSAEQLRGERVDPRADLFAFGCVLYEMLAGAPPFHAPKAEEDSSLLAQVESGRYARVRSRCRDAPRSLVWLVRQCLRPRAARRIASAMEIRKRLEGLLGRPSSVAAAETLTAFFWDRHVFEPREAETVVMVARQSDRDGRRAARLGFAVAAAVAAFVLLTLSLVDPARMVGWTDRVWAGRVEESLGRFEVFVSPAPPLESEVDSALVSSTMREAPQP